jgi:hypothetical protein
MERSGNTGAAMAWLALLLAVAPALAPPCVSAEDAVAPARGAPLFYRGQPYGSEAHFNPLTSFINYALDPLQVPESFDDDHFGSRLDEVLGNLIDPVDAIEEEGGFKAFVNRQILPIDPGALDDSLEMIPNYALHLLGGGLVYRKNVEWFQAHGYRYPRAYAALTGTLAEILQEVLEKRSTSSDDEVADVYLFRPAGMLLFNWDAFARFAAHTLRLVEWPYQPMIDPARASFTNAGQSYAARPTFFGAGAHLPFVYFGLTTLFGMSHRTGAADAVSWGVGAAIVDADPNEVRMRTSGGLFYDRDDSLLGSLIVNGTDGLRARLNLYSGALLPSRWWSPGLYVGVADDGDVVGGVALRVLPLGLARAPR